ncbi:hypothetical protein [Curtobacterium sp. MCBD17_040]|uniref:hypothetical protein n=1 Tax=Curtobacterium sp. MCBD17_040 TaxID=2175674 RepID=UPI000DA7E83D|nr:hypothetical protein [Curtobacterium sp. MCBD17_040]WIB65302.1 hypothetical protein DEI94_18015 [Curtobacterium sp. MCBD17_040]
MTATTAVLPDDRMRELGFSEHRLSRWYLCRRVGPDLTLNISIDKTAGMVEENVLNEMFLQPEQYGLLPEPLRTATRDAIDAVLRDLSAAGLTVTVDHPVYGC